MKKLLCYTVAVGLCLSLGVTFAAPVCGEHDYVRQHMDYVVNHSIIPLEVTVQYLVGEDDSQDSITETLANLRNLALNIVGNERNEYEKARAISAWVADNIYYDRVASENGVTPETYALKNVIETNRTICSGYANLTAALLAAIGLKSVTILGNTSFNDDANFAGNPHEWTAFWYERENRWVLLDSGWDSYNYYDGEYVKGESPRKHFDLSAEGFSHTHRAKKAEFRNWFDESFIVNDSGSSTREGLPSKIVGDTTAASVEVTTSTVAPRRERDVEPSPFPSLWFAIGGVIITFGAGVTLALVRGKKR